MAYLLLVGDYKIESLRERKWLIQVSLLKIPVMNTLQDGLCFYAKSKG